MKKYDCPDCGAEMDHNSFFDMMFCEECGLLMEDYILDRIWKLKAQLHKMRNCQNCKTYFYNKELGMMMCNLKSDFEEEECIDNDRKRWSMK